MAANCPSGHTSQAGDYCDQCGLKIEGPAKVGTAVVGTAVVGGAGVFAGVATVAPGGVGTPGTCPNCAGDHDGSTIFCEDCGYDFVTGTMPQTAVPATWLVVVSIDQAHYDRVGDTSVPLPVGVADRTVELPDGEALIGRKSNSRNIHPAIDLSPAPEDVAVSRQHAMLRRALNGSFTVEDLESANGTYVNDALTPIAAKQAIPVKNGDRIFVGAWTKLTLVSL